MKKELYLHCDIEADGPIPGMYSMLSLGAIVTDRSGGEFGEFKINLLPLHDARQNPATMRWWSKQPEAYKKATEGAINPYKAIRAFQIWLMKIRDKENATLVFVGYPVTFDFMFVYWYMISFVGESPFGISGFDIKTAASVIMQRPFRETTKKTIPPEWFEGAPEHTHDALEDAKGQMCIFVNMLRGRW